VMGGVTGEVMGEVGALRRCQFDGDTGTVLSYGTLAGADATTDRSDGGITLRQTLFIV